MSIDVEASLRFPRFSRVADLLIILSTMKTGDGPDVFGGYVSAVGYAIGACWDGPPLAAAGPPPPAGSDVWREYGDAVADAVQDLGWTMADMSAAVFHIGELIKDGIADLAAAPEAAKNS